DLFTGVEGAEDFLADRFLLDTLDEVVGDGEVDVSVEQGLADFLQAVVDIGRGEPAAATEAPEGVGEAALNAFKHGVSPPTAVGHKTRHSRAEPVRRTVNHQIYGICRKVATELEHRPPGANGRGGPHFSPSEVVMKWLSPPLMVGLVLATVGLA